MMNNTQGIQVTQQQVDTYLDELRQSGVTNMFGAGAYLETQFGLDTAAARTMLVAWMENFGERGNPLA